MIRSGDCVAFYECRFVGRGRGSWVNEWASYGAVIELPCIRVAAVCGVRLGAFDKDLLHA